MAFMVRYCGSMDARWAALALHFYVHCPTEMACCLLVSLLTLVRVPVVCFERYKGISGAPT